MVARLRVGLPYLLEHDVRCAVAHLAPGDMTVFDGNDGMLGVLGPHVVDHDLTAAAEGRSNALCDLLQGLQRCGFYGLSLLFPPSAVQIAQLSLFEGSYFHPYDTINRRNCNHFLKKFLQFKFFV